MNNQSQQNDTEHRSSRRFIKGVHRAFFTPVDPEDIVVTPKPQPQQPQPQAVPQPIPVATLQPVTAVPPAAPVPPPQVTMPAPAARKDVVPPGPAPIRPKQKKSVAKFIFFMLLGIVLAGAGGYSFYMYWNSQQQLQRLSSASAQSYVDLETETLVKRVGQHFLLPNETPIVRTLEGVDQKTRNEPFYAHAKDGDKVLVYSQRAILYDPDLDKIIEVGAIRQITPTPALGQNATSSASPSVAGAATISGKVLINNEKK